MNHAAVAAANEAWQAFVDEPDVLMAEADALWADLVEKRDALAERGWVRDPFDGWKRSEFCPGWRAR